MSASDGHVCQNSQGSLELHAAVSHRGPHSATVGLLTSRPTVAERSVVAHGDGHGKKNTRPWACLAWQLTADGRSRSVQRRRWSLGKKTQVPLRAGTSFTLGGYFFQKFQSFREVDRVLKVSLAALGGAGWPARRTSTCSLDLGASWSDRSVGSAAGIGWWVRPPEGSARPWLGRSSEWGSWLAEYARGAVAVPWHAVLR